MASAEYMRKWRANNVERAREIDRASKANHRDRSREYQRTWMARWRAENSERVREIAKKYADKNRLKIRAESRIRYYADVDKSRAYARQKADEKRQWLSAIKMTSGCVDCGFKVHPDALQFDHLPQYEKSFNIGPGRGKKKSTLLAEIAKCEVRCANCHAIKTALRRMNG